MFGSGRLRVAGDGADVGGWLSATSAATEAEPGQRAGGPARHRVLDLDRGLDLDCLRPASNSNRPVAPSSASPESPVLDVDTDVVTERADRAPWFARFGSGLVLAGLDISTATTVGTMVVVGTGQPLRVVAMSLGLVLSFRATGLYRRRLSFSALDDAPFLVGGALLATAGVLAVALMQGQAITPQGARDAGFLVTVLVSALLLERTMTYWGLRRCRRAGLFCERALVIGAGHVGQRLVRNLQEHLEYGLVPIGFLDSHPRVGTADELPAPVLGGYSKLADVIREYRITRVIVAFSAVREAGLVDVLRTCDRLDCELSFVPRLFELHRRTRSMDEVWGLPLMHMRRAPFRSFSWRLKRVFDIVMAATGLLLLAPVLAACALLVRLESGPGVLFRQERVGLDERPFQILKFRTLRPLDDDEAAVRWTVSGDPRIGPVGRLMRTTSLDELPQLWNILTGRMSVVGPRPERRHFVSQFSSHVPRYTARHRVPAGLTGWAQVHGLRGNTSIEERAVFDNAYVENWSLWGDVKIVLRTAGSVLRRTGG